MTYKTTERQRAQARGWQAANPMRFWWLMTRVRAKKRGIEFTITEDDLQAAFPADGKCPVFGVPLSPPGVGRGTTRRGPRDDSASIDRFDNAAGYVPGNISVISWRANRLKYMGTPDEFKAVARWLSQQEQLRSLL